MNKKLTGKCDCCRDESDDLEHFDLLVFGSEGVWLCLACRIMVCDFIANATYTFGRQKVKAILERREKENVQPANQ